MTMFRCSWGNGPVDCSTYANWDLPNTQIQMSDNFCTSMPHFHQRVHHERTADPETEAWGWYTKWRDVKMAWINDPVQNPKIHGIAVDELTTNLENLGNVINQMVDVHWWCDSAGVPRPDWVMAITKGNELAVDYIIKNLDALFPGKVWWAPETYIACYEEGSDCGLQGAIGLMNRFVIAGLHSRTIYGLNLSHKTVFGQQPSCVYYNAYGTAPDVRNQAVYDSEMALVAEIVSHGEPFGFYSWTPSYTSVLSRSDGDAVLASVGA